nr:hypothetical protein [uncultured Butyrivibrio sp.]
MSKDESGIVRSQYSNFLGTDTVMHENTEKSVKKHDTQVDISLKKQQELDVLKGKDYNYMAEQDAEPGYDKIDGIISTPSNLDLIDGIVDSEEEIRFIEASKETHSPNHPMNSSSKRPSVLEALEKKKEIVQQREQDRLLGELEKTHDSSYVR